MSLVLLFHKPYGVLCQFTDRSGTPRRTLAEFIDRPGVYPAGRLDFDSEGLLLLTDDGALAHRLTDPAYAHPRTYWVQVERVPDARAIAQLERGVVIEGRRTRPARAHLLAADPSLPPRDPPIRFRKTVPTAWLELTLTEGQNRQVRKMTASVGHPTLRLVRVAIGSLHLGALAPGTWREATADEARALATWSRARKDAMD